MMAPCPVRMGIDGRPRWHGGSRLAERLFSCSTECNAVDPTRRSVTRGANDSDPGSTATCATTCPYCSKSNTTSHAVCDVTWDAVYQPPARKHLVMLAYVTTDNVRRRSTRRTYGTGSDLAGDAIRRECDCIVCIVRLSCRNYSSSDVTPYLIHT
jgi:hypothetical protein